MSRENQTVVRFDAIPADVVIRTIQRPFRAKAASVPKLPASPVVPAESEAEALQGSDSPGDQRTDETLLKLLSHLSAQLSELKVELEKDPPLIRESIIELSCMIAAHLIGKASEVQPLDLTDLVSDAIERLLPAGKITVRMNPADALELSAYRDQLVGDDCLAIVHDERMSRGECQISHDELTLSSSINTRLQNIRETLLKGLDHAWLEQGPVAEPARS